MVDDPAERDAMARVNQAAIEWYESERHDLSLEAAAREVLYHRLLLDPPDFVVAGLGSDPGRRGDLDALGEWVNDFTPRVAGQIRVMRGESDLTAAEIAALPHRAWARWGQLRGRELVDSGRSPSALRLYTGRSLNTEPEWLAQAFCDSARWHDYQEALHGYASSPGRRQWAGRHAVINAVIAGGEAAAACLRWVSRHIQTMEVLAGSQEDIVERLFYTRLLAQRISEPWRHRGLAERLLVPPAPGMRPSTGQFPVDQLRRALTWAAAGGPGGVMTLREVAGLYCPDPQWRDDVYGLTGACRPVSGVVPAPLRTDEILGDQAGRFAAELGDSIPLSTATVFRPHVLKLLRGDNPELRPAVRLALSSLSGGPDLAALAALARPLLPSIPADLEPGRMPGAGAPETPVVLATLVDYVDRSGQLGRFLAAVFQRHSEAPLVGAVHRAFVSWDDTHRRLLETLAGRS
jgi:hypothetical protein